MEQIVENVFHRLTNSPLPGAMLSLLTGLLLLKLFFFQRRSGKTIGALAAYRDEAPMLYWLSQIVVGSLSCMFIVLGTLFVFWSLLGNCTQIDSGHWRC